MAKDKDKDYEVGYRKPPKLTRFAKGRSGNPKGRPKGSRNLEVLINEELDRNVVIQENGKKLQLTKREALAKRIVNAALTGDAKSTSALISMDQIRKEAEPDVVELDETDHEQFQLLQQRMIDKHRREEDKRSKKTTPTKPSKTKAEVKPHEEAAR